MLGDDFAPAIAGDVSEICGAPAAVNDAWTLILPMPT